MKKIIKHLSTRGGFLHIVLPILLVVVLVLIGLFTFRHPVKNLSVEQARTQAESFVNNYLMTSGEKVTVKNVTREYGLYKMTIGLSSGEVESYLTRDGKLFFPQALDVAKISSASSTATSTAASNTATPSATVSVKTDKPVIELFVMSYCPYGTQIEKGILPVVATLGSKINFQLKFVNYAMHGAKELAENLTQYCIQKEQTAKLQDYLKCFLASSDSATCLTQTGVNTTKLASCVSETDTQYKVTANATGNVGYKGTYPSFNINEADNTKYSVGGSPTLIINGQEINSNRDSASLLKTICSAFNNQPTECQTVLSSASPAPGFGTGTAASGTGAAGCVQ